MSQIRHIAALTGALLLFLLAGAEIAERKGYDSEYVDPGARRYSFSLFFLPDRPWVPAWISLVAFGFAGVGPLLLGQEAKAVLLFGVEWLVVFPLGFLSGALPVFLLLFHAAVAVDTWVIARRLQAGQKVRKWEWGWQR